MLDAARIFVKNHNEAVALFHSDTDGLLQPFCVFVTDLQFVDHHLNVVVLITVHFHPAGDFLHLSVDADVQVTLPAHGLKEFPIMTFAAAHQRGED